MSSRVTQPRFLKPSTVAAELDVSRQTVYRLIHRGDLAAARIGGSIRVDRIELEKLVGTPSLAERATATSRAASSSPDES